MIKNSLCSNSARKIKFVGFLSNKLFNKIYGQKKLYYKIFITFKCLMFYNNFNILMKMFFVQN